MSDLHTAPIIADVDLADSVELPARKAAVAGLLRITLGKIKTYLINFLVPAGGTAGQVLTKVSGTAGDFAWAAAGVGLTDEQIQDMIATFLTNGANITLTYDDAGNHLSIAAAGSAAQFYHYGSFAVASVTASEVLMDHVVATAHTLQDDFAGCLASVGGNPTANPWVAKVQKNGADVGTLSITSAGVVTFVTTGTTVAMAAGDVLTVIGPAVADATLARLRFTFKGTI